MKTRRRLFLHSWTDRALLVSDRSGARGANTGQWVPRSQIEEVGREQVRNPLFGTAPQIAEFLGTVVTFDAPDWLLAKKGLTSDADIPEGTEA